MHAALTSNPCCVWKTSINASLVQFPSILIIFGAIFVVFGSHAHHQAAIMAATRGDACGPLAGFKSGSHGAARTVGDGLLCTREGCALPGQKLGASASACEQLYHAVLLQYSEFMLINVYFGV